MDERENRPTADSSEQPQQRTYIPKHEKADAASQSRQPVYDDFMYEPIGFEETGHEEMETFSFQIPKPVPKRSKGVTAAVVLFIILIAAALGIAALGIYMDITNSEEAINRIMDSRRTVLYQNSKPEGANDPENFVDSNGKYTLEGAAALVRPSIVEIYTYSDMQRTQLVGTGSGVILSKDGYIVTNAHVLQADGFHQVSTVDEKTYDAKVIGRDTKTDIAVIKVEAEGLTAAVLGDSDEAVVGEQVIAVGNPAGLFSTVTDGIISAVNRKIKGDSTGFEMTCIQTNAQISPGNSGGALVNMYGQVIGITSSKYVSSNLEGLGFAITINEALPIIEELMDKGYVGGRFRIGIQLIDMSTAARIASIEEAIGHAIPDDFLGIYIDSISEDSDIANTDLKAGDFITAINGKTVFVYDDFYNTISSMYTAGDTVPATCAHISESGIVTYYDIKFKLMEDKSGNY